MKNKFYRDLFSLTFITLLSMQMTAQQKALKIGDKIPEEIWTTPLNIVNNPQKTLQLSEDQDKLILIDFWATWCSACLKNFPKMEALEKQFGNQLKIVPVTKESHTTLDKFFNSKNGQRYKHITSVVEDKMLSTAFPYHAIPFIAWIKNGNLVNLTDAEQVTAETIGEILQNKKSSLQSVIQINRKRPLMLAEQFDAEKQTSLINYTLLSKGRIRAIQPGSGFHRTNGIVHGRQFTNTSLMNIYQGIVYEIFADKGDRFSQKRISNLVKNTDQIEFTTTNQETEALLYNFEFIVPLQNAAQLYPNMLTTLSEYSGYPATIESQRKRCLVLKKTSTADNLATKGGPPTDDFFKKPALIRNKTLETLIVALNVNDQLTPLPVIDETAYSGKVDLNLGNISDLQTLKKALKRYNLELTEEERDLQMLVIRDI